MYSVNECFIFTPHFIFSSKIQQYFCLPLVDRRFQNRVRFPYFKHFKHSNIKTWTKIALKDHIMLLDRHLYEDVIEQNEPMWPNIQVQTPILQPMLMSSTFWPLQDFFGKESSQFHYAQVNICFCKILIGTIYKKLPFSPYTLSKRFTGSI